MDGRKGLLIPVCLCCEYMLLGNNDNTKQRTRSQIKTFLFKIRDEMPQKLVSAACISIKKRSQAVEKKFTNSENLLLVKIIFCRISLNSFFFGKGKCIFGLDPVSNGSEETCRHLTRCTNLCLLSIQK
jgi:hypothetical protein